MFNDSIIEKIKSHAEKQFPKECCGIIVENKKGETKYIPCKNVSKTPKESFKIAEKRYADIDNKNKILAVFHSHPDYPNYPSKSDMTHQVASGVPWGICQVLEEYDYNDKQEEIIVPRALTPFWFGDGSPIMKLEERPFRHGVTDCYSLIRDWYKLERDMVLTEYPRNWNWWKEDHNLYERFLPAEKFFRVDESEAKEGDVIMFTIKSKVMNHSGLYLGNGLMIHHPSSYLGYDPSAISYKEPIYRWKKHISGYYRYVENS